MIIIENEEKNNETETLVVSNSIKGFQPQMTNRWVLKINGIDAYLMKSFRLPKIVNENISCINEPYDRFTELELICLEGELSTTQQLMNWIRSNEKRNASLDILDQYGVCIEKWTLENIGIESIYFTELNYLENDLRTVRCRVYIEKINFIY